MKPDLLHPIRWIEAESESFRVGRAEEHMGVIGPFMQKVLSEWEINQCADFGCGEGHIFNEIAQMVLRKNPWAACLAVDWKAKLEERFLAELIPFKEDIFETSVADDTLDLLVLNYMVQAMWTKRGQRALIKLAKTKMREGGYLLLSEIIRFDDPQKNLIAHAKHIVYNGPLVAYNVKPLVYYEGLLENEGFSLQKVGFLGDGAVILARLDSKE